MTHQEFWNEYRRISGVEAPYEAWAFGDAPDILAELVRSGIKTATASLRLWYAEDGSDLPQTDTYSVILDSRENAVCVVRNTRVYTCPFDDVTGEHARKEGEGDRSITYWRKVHEDFFSAELLKEGKRFDPSMEVVCEEFEKVFP